MHNLWIIYVSLHTYAMQYMLSSIAKTAAQRKEKTFPGINSADNQCCCISTRHSQAVALTSAYLEAGVVEFAHVKLHPDDGKHDNGEEKQQADLKQRYHGFHYGLQHHLETWETEKDGEE